MPVLRLIDQDVRKVEHGEYDGDEAIERHVHGVLPKDAFPLPRAAEGVLDIVAESA